MGQKLYRLIIKFTSFARGVGFEFRKKTSQTIQILKNLKISNYLRINFKLNILSLFRQKKFQYSSLLIVGVIVVSLVAQNLLVMRKGVSASDDYDFDFSVSENYSLSDGSLIEISGNSAKLKVREYATDASTVGLYHLNETEGSTVNDASDFNNDGTTANLSWSAEGKLNGAANLNGTTSHITVPTSDSLNITGANTIEAWTKFNSEFSDSSHNHRQFIATKGGYSLYYDHTTGKVVYEIADANPSGWERLSGDDISGPWDLNGKLTVFSQVWLGSDLYVGTGNAISDAEVWKWNGTSWSMIGGDGINSSWEINKYEYVMSLATDGTNIYAGLGTGVNEAEVWIWNGAGWSKISDDHIWGANYTQVNCLNYMNGVLYAGIGGASAGMGEVWKYENSTWEKIADVSLGFPAGNAYEHAYSMANDGTNLYVGMGLTANDADIWKYSEGTWEKIGGDDVTNWNGNYEYVLSLVYTNGTLYAGLGTSANDADVFQYSGSGIAWSKIGGDGTGWGANYDGVYSMVGGGGKLFVGLGVTAGENEVRVWNGSSWTQLGGDGLRSGWTNTHTVVESLSYSNNTVYAGLRGTSQPGYIWSYTDVDMSDDIWDGTWTKFGGNGILGSWGQYGLETVTSMAVADGKLYAGTGISAGDALVWQYDGTDWLLIGGQNTNNSWSIDTYEQVNCMISYKGDLYVGLGLTANDAEVWKWNGSTWSQVGGDGVGWGANYEHVYSMAVYKDKLYVGLGLTVNDAEVWEYDGTNWTALPVGGDGRNESWNSAYEMVYSLVSDGTYLYAGLGNGAGDAEVWRYDGSTWGGARIGGDGDNSSWANSTYQTVESMTIFRGELCVGLGNATAGHAEVWKWNGSTWAMIGGDGNGGWDNYQYERVVSMAVYNGDLYASLGNTAGDGEIFIYSGSGTNWTKSAGFSLGNWAANIEYVTALTVYNGRLFAGTGATANTDAGVWSYGSNGYLASETIGQDTNWHHIAATYDGSTMKIYIDGVLNSSINTTKSIKTTSLPLYIGSSIGVSESGTEPGVFSGLIDELRISNTSRSSFYTTKYTPTEQTVKPAYAILTSQVKSWDGFEADESSDGGSIKYRLSSDGGTNWKYWDGNTSQWTASTSFSQTNTESEIDDNISSFTVGSGGIIWQAYLKSNGEQLVILNSVTILYTPDTTDPTNPTIITSKNSSGGDVNLENDGWASYTTPYFQWNEEETEGGASDFGGSGIDGYYLYFGEPNESDECVGNPETTSGLLTPNQGALYYQTGREISIQNGTMSTGNTYCLRLQSKDKAGNIQNNVWQAFKYRFDATAPTAPSGISVNPIGYTNNDNYAFTISNHGSDVHSEVKQYEYRTGGDDADEWFVWDKNNLTLTIPNDDHPTGKYQDGPNHFYFRVKDNANNLSSIISTTYYFGASAPSEPVSLKANPDESESNNFTFEWDVPNAYIGDANKITYYYSVNAEPTQYNTQSAYTTSKAVGPGAFATQQGENRFYVVAKDEAGNIDWNNFASIIFIANTANPPAPTGVKASDISDKKEDLDPSGDSGEYRVVVSWNIPQTIPDQGNFNGYRVYYSENSSSGYSALGETLGNAYVHLNLEKDHTYYYYVTSIDKTGGESIKSDDYESLPDPVNEMPHETATGKFKYAPSINDYPDCQKSGTRCDSNNKVAYSFGAKTATISWNTSRNARPEVQYGTSIDNLNKTAAVSITSASSAHEVLIANLNPETTYYYRVIYTDEDGNFGIYPANNTAPLTFTTTASPKVSTLQVENVTLNSIFITWQSTVESHGSVKYRSSNESAQNSKIIQESGGNYSLDHSVHLKDLTHDTIYLFQINALDTENNLFESDEYITATLPLPKVNDDLKAENKFGVDSPTVIVNYTTNVETTTVIKFNSGSGAKSYVDLAKTKNHTAEISGLAPKTAYIIEVTGTDNYGNDAISKNFQITTESDTLPPKIISKTEKKRIIGEGQKAEAQLTVKLESNEPTTMIVEAAEGISKDRFDIVSNEDPLALNHNVILKLREAGKTYSYRVQIKDAAGNITTSEVKTVVIQGTNKTAFEYALAIFSRSFGWLSTLFKKQ